MFDAFRVQKPKAYLCTVFCIFLGLCFNPIALADAGETYTFDGLTNGNLDGQDNWMIYHLQGTEELSVSDGAGIDGSKAVVGPNADSQKITASRVNNDNYSILPVPGFFDTEHHFYIIEWEMTGTYWGAEFGLGYDENEDGHILESDGELGISLKAVWGEKKFSFKRWDDYTNASWMDATTATNRYQIVIDRNANSGAGAASVWVNPIEAGGATEWKAIADLQDIPLNFNEGTGVSNPANWNGMFLYSNGQGPISMFDNISFRQVTLSTRSVEFADTFLEQTDSKVITLEGVHLNSNLTATLSGDFTFTDGTQQKENLGDGDSIEIVFRPSAVSDRLGTMTLQGDDMAAPVTVELTGTGVNKPPVAEDQNVTTDEDTPIAIMLSGSDDETLEADLIYTIEDQPVHGVLSGSGRNITYTPDANYHGTDSFTFTVTDTGDGASGALTSAKATVSIIVDAVNDMPQAMDQHVSTDEDQAVGIILSGTDVETAATALTYTIENQPLHGVLSGSGRNITYTPDANYHGTDSFTFTVTDEVYDTSDPATVSMTVNPVNDAPLANGQNIDTFENMPVSITLSGTDVESAAEELKYTVTAGPMHGTLSGDGRDFIYTPNDHFSGGDSFAFTVTDNVYKADSITSVAAIVNITVHEVNDVPIAIGQNVSTHEDMPIVITLSGTDMETAATDLTYTIENQTLHGVLSGSGRNITYTPDNDYNGSDRFTFTVTDEVYDTSPPATISITVDAVNDMPQAMDQHVSTDEDQAVGITLSGTDVETAATDLTYTIEDQPVHGVLSGSGRNITYTPNANYHGTDSFTFTVTDDGDGLAAKRTSATAQVTVTVNPVVESGSGSSSDSDTMPSAPEPIVTEIEADVQTNGFNGDQTVLQTKIQRTIDDAIVTDYLELDDKHVQEAIFQLEEMDGDTVRVILPDEEDEVSETVVDIPLNSLQHFEDRDANLEISLPYATIIIPNTSLSTFEEDLYFRIVPVKDEQEKESIIKRATQEERWVEQGDDGDMKIMGRPMVIETNMQSKPVTIVLPLYDALPEDPDEQQSILDNLVIYIEHHDGTSELIKGEVTPYRHDEILGIQFDIDKFSTFTMLYWEGANVVLEESEVDLPQDVFTFAYQGRYILGYPDGTFRPNQMVTRAEMATMIARNLTLHIISNEETTVFTDLSDTHWAHDSIIKAVQGDIVSGYPDGTFRSDQPITRGEMAVIAQRLAKLDEKQGSTFSDTEHHWASGAIEAVKEAGIISGYPDGSFKPDQGLSRAEAVTILNRLLQIEVAQIVSEPTWSDVPASHWAFPDIEAATSSSINYGF